MTFSEVIEKIMPEVNNGSNEPFIIYRDGNGKWDYDFTQNAGGETFDWVKDVKKTDPFAVTLTSSDLSDGSFSYIYDRILNERLRAEFETAQFPDADRKQLESLMNMFEENIGELSQDATDYIMRFDRPLASLNKMVTVNLIDDDSDYGYNMDAVGEAIEQVEQKIKDFITRPIDEPFGINAEKRNIEGYEERLSIQLAGKYVVLAENPTYLDPYLICNIKRDNPLGMEERYDGVVTDNYLEAMREFVNRVDGLLGELEAERRESGLPFQTLTAAEHCISDSYKGDYESYLVVIKPETLAPEYRSAEYQLALCMGGGGASAESLGRAVFVKELLSGQEKRYDRTQIAGLANPEKIPAWAVDKLLEHLKKDGINADNVNLDEMSRREKNKTESLKKPTLQEKLDKAKKKAAEQDSAKKDEHGDKPKKRGERE